MLIIICDFEEKYCEKYEVMTDGQPYCIVKDHQDLMQKLIENKMDFVMVCPCKGVERIKASIRQYFDEDNNWIRTFFLYEEKDSSYYKRIHKLVNKLEKPVLLKINRKGKLCGQK